MVFIEAFQEMKNGKLVQYWHAGKLNIVKLTDDAHDFLWWSHFDEYWVPFCVGASLIEDTTWEICEQDPEELHHKEIEAWLDEKRS